MKRNSTKTNREPSKASLREMPEVDLSRYRVVGRGRHVDTAKRSFESVILDRKAVKTLGGPDAIREIVETLARTVREARKKHRAA